MSCSCPDSFVGNFVGNFVELLSGADKARTLDYALGSTLECAACLDIATIKGRLNLNSLSFSRKFLALTSLDSPYFQP